MNGNQLELSERQKIEGDVSSSHQNTTASRQKLFSLWEYVLVSCQWKYESLLQSFVLAVIWAASAIGWPRTHLFQWWTRETKHWSMPSVEQEQIFPRDFHIIRCTLFYVLVCLDQLWSNLKCKLTYQRCSFRFPTYPPPLQGGVLRASIERLIDKSPSLVRISRFFDFSGASNEWKCQHQKSSVQVWWTCHLFTHLRMGVKQPVCDIMWEAWHNRQLYLQLGWFPHLLPSVLCFPTSLQS